MSAIYSLGVMTGTSCDGADLALLKLSITTGGKWSETLAKATRRDFPRALRQRLRAAQRGKLSIRQSALLARDYSRWLGVLCSRALKSWGTPRARVVIAVHGQTVWHEPENAISVQLLDPSVIAAATGCTVTAAFRQPDLARGGDGAPLVPYYHWLRVVTGKLADDMPFAIQNIGGIANLTYVTKNPKKLLAFDSGPGNSLIDLAMEKASNGKLHFDNGGRVAASAARAIDWRKIERLGDHPYFRKAPPKSTGRELFNEAFLRKLPGEGALLVAHATALAAHTMARAYRDFVIKHGPLRTVYVAGGGAQNPTLLRLFSRELARLTRREILVAVLPKDFAPAQYLEAMAFARLGFEALQGNPVSLAAVTGARADALGAGIFPGENFRSLLKLLDVR